MKLASGQRFLSSVIALQEAETRTTVSDPNLAPAERAAVELAERIRNKGLAPLLELRLNDGDAQVARAALDLLKELDGDILVGIALDAAVRLSR